GEAGGHPTQGPEGRNPASAGGAASAQRPTRGRFLRDRILAIASVNPTATAQKLLLILINDPELPADTRLAVGRRVFQSDRPRSAEGRSKKSTAHIHRPNQGSPHGKPADQGREPQPRTSTTSVGSVGLATFPALDLLLRIAQDEAASPAERHKAASEVAQHFLPKKIASKKSRRPKFPPDEYGFSVDPNLARELRDTKLKLACLPLSGKKLSPYAVAQKATKLQ